MVKNLWNDQKAESISSPLEELVYRSNLIGSDRAVCNVGGGNTSMKTVEKDFRNRDQEVMWVKGSGSDLASMGPENFTGLNLEDIKPLLEREDMSDEEMVKYLSNCMIDSSHPRSSIETLLHAFLPFKHVDHTHPDAIISICCADNGREVADEIFGDRYVWVPYIRPGFKLSKMIAEGVAANPKADLVLMEKHGLVVWGDTAKESYDKTISVILEAEAYINKQNSKEPFGGDAFKSLSEAERKEVLSEILPLVRGQMKEEKQVLLTYDDNEAVLEFVNGKNADSTSQVGAACPDHLVHTKRVPLYISWDPQKDSIAALKDKLKKGIHTYKSDYRDYFERNKRDGDEMFEPAPRVILIPGIGMINSGKDVKMANVSGALYNRAIQVMKGAEKLGKFVSLNEKESYEIEYWPLELYKLSLAPPESEFSRSTAIVTGGAGGIGGETCKLYAQQGAHVIVTDLNLEGAQQVADKINASYGAGRAIAVKMDVTKEEEIKSAYQQAVLHFGGIDIIVNNAGLATSNPIEETTLKEWQLNMDVLGTGYFLVSKQAFSLLKDQGTGGAIVFVGSKNSVYAGKNASAYSSVKALEAHLARCLAAEGGAFGIRVNTVLPDAVLQGSAIWDSSWKEERAAAYGIHPDELQEHYRKRTTLLVDILPEDIAKTIAFLSSSQSSKTTGCMITVDGGVPAAFTR
ncbi:bifunctional aldolase/short-chain dehydrogenase [Alkalicoccus halolimnae]|uniref:Bifunctional aldolase/short-chain dehydrogenase n=1 Tax=Alkalicoccus halolimnae TaxID=1667239 RepID=A0A5C7F977_9BACI|nr:bifunctional aldolase/short-chain dehydrogenase [Alkalicoccus halolimnae]TXF86160.1 bifunctional aldolase/short-chain dehydrogenase [Alkalicoccus halolimnae]